MEVESLQQSQFPKKPFHMEFGLQGVAYQEQTAGSPNLPLDRSEKTTNKREYY